MRIRDLEIFYQLVASYLGLFLKWPNCNAVKSGVSKHISGFLKIHEFWDAGSGQKSIFYKVDTMKMEN